MTRPGCDHRSAVMKRLFILLAVFGCSKTNDVPELRNDAVALVKYYQPKREEIERRFKDVINQSGRVPKNLPGSDEATRALADTKEKLGALDKLEKQVEKQADALANEGKREELQRLVQDEEHQFEQGISFANENMSEAESWLAEAIRSNGRAPAQPAPTATGEENIGTVVP
jgi:hypothetical protein